MTDQVAPLKGLSESNVPFSIRLTFRERPKSSTGTGRVVAAIDLFSFVDEQAEVVLYVTQKDGAPPAAIERQLIAVLIARTREIME